MENIYLVEIVKRIENYCCKCIFSLTLIVMYNNVKITLYYQDIVVYYFIFIIIFPPSTFMEPYLYCFGSFSQKIYTSQYTNNISKRPKVFYGKRQYHFLCQQKLYKPTCQLFHNMLVSMENKQNFRKKNHLIIRSIYQIQNIVLQQNNCSTTNYEACC